MLRWMLLAKKMKKHVDVYRFNQLKYLRHGDLLSRNVDSTQESWIQATRKVTTSGFNQVFFSSITWGFDPET